MLKSYMCTPVMPLSFVSMVVVLMTRVFFHGLSLCIMLEILRSNKHNFKPIYIFSNALETFLKYQIVKAIFLDVLLVCYSVDIREKKNWIQYFSVLPKNASPKLLFLIFLGVMFDLGTTYSGAQGLFPALNSRVTMGELRKSK